MARANITVIAAPGAYAGSMTALTWTTVATGTSSGMQFTMSGAELIIARHAGTASGVLGLTSVDDPYGRPETLTINFTSGQYKIIGPMKKTGWMQSTGKFFLHSASTRELTAAVVTIPGL